MAANSGEMLSKMAADGLGVVMLPTFIAHRLVCDGALVPLLTHIRWPDTTAYAVYPPNTTPELSRPRIH